MLISFSGLPGVGKSSVARLLAQRIKAVWLRIDSLEQALVRSGVVDRDGLGPAGYYVGYALALDNLRLGLTVLADCVNPLALTRNAWRDVAFEAGAELLEVEFALMRGRIRHGWKRGCAKFPVCFSPTGGRYGNGNMRSGSARPWCWIPPYCRRARLWRPFAAPCGL